LYLHLGSNGEPHVFGGGVRRYLGLYRGRLRRERGGGPGRWARENFIDALAFGPDVVGGREIRDLQGVITRLLAEPDARDPERLVRLVSLI
jgi:hypothetical protein